MKSANALYKTKLILLITIITSPFWILLFFHFLPDLVNKKRLDKHGIKTIGKIEFYSKEKIAGPGKLGGLNTRDIMVANYIYFDNKNKIFKEKAKSSEVKVSTDSTLKVLFLKKEPTIHLVISRSGKGSLGKTRN